MLTKGGDCGSRWGVGSCHKGGKTQKIGRIILRVIFLFRNTFRPDATQGWGLWFEVGSWFLSQGWEDTESRKNNSESDFFVPEYFPTGCYLRVESVVPGGKTQKVGRIILRVIFLFRNTFRPDATQGWGLWFEVGRHRK
ncbi:MAG: hypothetical protein SWX82_04940 [Cyanobacteriota bacterium]|nr:hypothetical protein [Cyanobacteriota bacterium]